MRNITKISLIVSSALFLTACQTTKLDEKPPVESRAAEPAKVAENNARNVEPIVAKTVDPLDDPQGVLAKRSVYFDYDSYVVKDEYASVVQNHAKYLSGNKARKIIIQGNTDERGGNEYNLALGQKRAEAVRKSMNALGVADAQMEAVSLGKTKPKTLGSDEAAWAENRRADIVY
jgi:peptidoglycan-associated lipoprotein